MALNNVPLNGQNLDETRTPINANFVDINSQFAIDHVEFNTSGNGKHNKITFPIQASSPTGSGTDLFLYSKANVVNIANGTQINVTRSAAVNLVLADSSYAMTGWDMVSPLTAAVTTTSWSYLPSGMLMISGRSVTNGSGTVTITFNSQSDGGSNSFPGFSANASYGFITSVNVTQIGSGITATTAKIASYTLTTLTVNAANNTGFFWSVVGSSVGQIGG